MRGRPDLEFPPRRAHRERAQLNRRLGRAIPDANRPICTGAAAHKARVGIFTRRLYRVLSKNRPLMYTMELLIAGEEGARLNHRYYPTDIHVVAIERHIAQQNAGRGR